MNVRSAMTMYFFCGTYPSKFFGSFAGSGLLYSRVTRSSVLAARAARADASANRRYDDSLLVMIVEA